MKVCRPVLPDLTDQDLKDIGVLLGHRRKLLRAIAELEEIEKGEHLKRTVAAYEAGRDGFWLARWLRARRRGLRHPSGQCRCRANIGARRLIASTQNY